MRDFNEVTIIGHVGQDGELKVTPANKAVLRFSLATSVKWVDKNSGEWKQLTEWHNVVAWEKAAETLALIAKKGNRIMVKGKIHYNKFKKQDGSEVIETQIQAEDFAELTSSMKEGGSTSTGRAKNPIVEDVELPF